MQSSAHSLRLKSEAQNGIIWNVPDKTTSWLFKTFYQQEHAQTRSCGGVASDYEGVLAGDVSAQLKDKIA